MFALLLSFYTESFLRVGLDTGDQTPLLFVLRFRPPLYMHLKPLYTSHLH